MAFSSTITKVTRGVPRGKRAYGTWTNGASTDAGGEITTGLQKVETFSAQVTSHLGSEPLKVTLNSSSNGAVTIVTSTGAVTGIWSAYGY